MAFNNVTGSTATTLKPPGLYYISSTMSGDKTWLLGTPYEGAEVTVLVATQSTKVATIGTNSSAQTLFGSTANDLSVSTGQACAKVQFIGLSSSVWGWSISSKSTTAKCTLAGSTR